MNKVITSVVIVLCMCLNACTSTSENKPAKKNLAKPNIIILLADDMGYGELGCYGQKLIKTPFLDKLASEGVLY
ncbi:sulfatase-like hydrolase/transferase [Labilibacter marinus]|uniref:sulfatase-like hydrolase/transferase n=1 Tax=Labilibacter marinus TaxID=1477105 RepID=UPI0018E931F1|nr:sulfatase-like hydrolase/transferase [Labilibacter marinus]